MLHYACILHAGVQAFRQAYLVHTEGYYISFVPQRPQPDGMSGLDSVQKAMESVQRKMAVYEGSLLQVQSLSIWQLTACPAAATCPLLSIAAECQT